MLHFPLFSRRAWLAALVAPMLAACGGSTDSTDVKPPSGAIEKPLVINLYPNESATNAPRLVVMVSSVGSVTVSMPLLFDTGSAGVTLYAPDIFPSSMVTPQGFVFPSGQASITYNGITVTNQQGKRTYGTLDPRAQNGNIGYAQLTFGDAQGRLTTGIMPVFFYYSVTDVTTGQTLNVSAAQRGVFGVASGAGPIVLPGSIEPPGGYPACSSTTNSTCWVVSALMYLQYGAGVNAGFMLTPAPLQSCDITTPGSCTPAPMLTVGLSAALESGFSAMSLTCPPNGYVGPATIAGYPVCQKAIANTMIAVSGQTVGTISGNTVFDTGTSAMQIATPAGNSFPSVVAAGSSVLVTTPSGFAYDYIADSAQLLNTNVNANSTAPSIVGIGYFTTNSLFTDYSSGSQGWK
jgi:hypothetical protein